MGGMSSKPATAAPAKKVAKPPGGTVSEVDRAMLDLKNARDRLQRYRKKLDADDEKLLQQARAFKAAGKTDRALGILRLRKYKQQQAQNCEDQLLNVLTMVETIDSKQNEKGLLEALSKGKDALKQMHEENSVEKVLDLMDAIQEEIQIEQEITDILQNVPTLSVTDEALVEEELEALAASMQQEQEPQQTEQEQEPTINLPDAPKTDLPKLPDKQPVVPQQQQQEPERRVAVPG